MVEQKKIMIVGGGFGGLNVAKALRGADVEVLLIDKTNHHVFQPLLYQVASAALSPANIASPLREVLSKQKNASVIMADITAIDLANQQIRSANGDAFPYDTLVLAVGSRHHYFGHNTWEPFAPGLKTLSDAVRIRERILLAFERAERMECREEVEKYLRFVIVGGGPTGVEMAGAIAEIAHKTMFRDFRNIDPSQSEIYLIEGHPRVLPPFSERLSAKAKADLEKMGVKVICGAHVTDVSEEGVRIGEQLLPTTNVIWAAGNRASPILETLGVEQDTMGRVVVGPDLSVPNHPNVFVIGDAAHAAGTGGDPLPGIAPVAIQQGHYVAKLIKKSLPQPDRKPFHYLDKGTIATIGRAKAVAMIRGSEFSGFFAWLIWSLVHIFYLVTFRNRFVVGFQWMFSYLTGRRAVRLIKPAIYDDQTVHMHHGEGIPASLFAHTHAGLEHAPCSRLATPKGAKE